MGGQEQVEQSTTSNIADSFPGMENMQPVAPTAKPKSQSVQLKKPPKPSKEKEKPATEPG